MSFSILPSEVKEEIFSLLAPEDLFRCLRVCHEWRRICNSERLWKKTLSERNLQFNHMDDIVEFSGPICRSALMWKQYAATCAGWCLNSYRTELIPYETSEELTCSRIYVFRDKMALISNKIQVFNFNRDSFTKEIIPLPFVPHAVTMNSKYIVCTIGNIVLIYKKNHVYKKYCAIALLENSSVAIETQKFKSFIEAKQKFGPYIKAEAVLGDYLWICCLNKTLGNLSVINLKTLEISHKHTSSRLVSMTDHKVVALGTDKIHVFDFEGNVLSVLTPETGFSSFRATDKYIVTFEAFGGQADIWSTEGKYLWTLNTSFYNIKLDSKRQLLYTCLGALKCELCAYSLESGVLAWTSQLPHINSSEVDDMFLVCDKFLIIDIYLGSPSPVFHYGFVYDLDNQTLLYKAVLRGYTMHVSDNLWVQKRQNDLIVYVYK